MIRFTPQALCRGCWVFMSRVQTQPAPLEFFWDSDFDIMTSILIRYTDARIWIWYDMKWYDTIRYEMILYELWYDVIWHVSWYWYRIDLNVDILILIWYWHWYDITFLWWIFLQQHRQHNPPFILFTACNQEAQTTNFHECLLKQHLFICTLPAANIAPENGWLEDENFFWDVPLQVLCLV